MSIKINFKPLTIFSKFSSYMLAQAVKCSLTPVLAASSSEQFFWVVRSDNSSYQVGPKIQPKFPEG